MWDFFHLDDNALEVQVFNASAGFSIVHYQVWQKPRGAKMVQMLLIGSGGSGGAGFSGSAGSGRGGGGGGGSGGITRLMIPAMLLPDNLFVYVGKGGDQVSFNGDTSLITITPNSSTTPYLLAYALGGSGGGAGSTGSPGSAGNGGVIMATNNSSYRNLGFIDVLGGVSGGAGGVVGSSTSNLTALNPPAYYILSGGAGGGSTPTANTNFAGGAITGNGIVPTVNGGAAGSNNGAQGVEIKRPFCASGGGGGGSNGTGTGGNGGNGAIGCGGGGGGAGVTGGTGGLGGDAIIIITTIM